MDLKSLVARSIAVVLLSGLDGAMEALQDGRCVDVNAVREFWNGAESARCRFFCDRAPCAKCDVIPFSCEKNHTDGRS